MYPYPSSCDFPFTRGRWIARLEREGEREGKGGRVVASDMGYIVQYVCMYDDDTTAPIKHFRLPPMKEIITVRFNYYTLSYSLSLSLSLSILPAEPFIDHHHIPTSDSLPTISES
jgi:hypothetical protein